MKRFFLHFVVCWCSCLGRQLFDNQRRVLEGKSGRRGSNPRRPAWEIDFVIRGVAIKSLEKTPPPAAITNRPRMGKLSRSQE